MRVWLLVLAALVVAPTPAAAQPAPPTSGAVDPMKGRSADAVRGAPTEDRIDGVRVAPPPPAAERARWVPRVILFVPRWTVWAIAQPFRGLAWVYERHQVRERLTRFFFNDTETLGIYPVALFETGFGLNIGGRVVVRDLFDAGEGLKLRASYGGRFTQLYSARLTTGERLGRVELTLEGEYDLRNQDRFFGIGNGDVVEPGAVMTPIDPRADSTAIATRFRQRVGTLRLGTSTRVVGAVHIKVSTGLIGRSFEPTMDLDDDASLTDAYAADGLVGYGTGLSATYSELELSYDTRRPSRWYLSRAVASTGWRLGGYAGYTLGFGDDESGFVRYGADLQRYLDLYGGNRVLALRVFVEGVTAGRDEVPFVELPRLGGSVLLRGYDQDRFRDRVAGLATAEYQWELYDAMSAFGFVDVGRVWRSLGAATVDHARVGFGGGIELHSAASFQARLFLASSIDGGFFFNLGLDPVFDARSRLRK